MGVGGPATGTPPPTPGKTAVQAEAPGPGLGPKDLRLKSVAPLWGREGAGEAKAGTCTKAPGHCFSSLGWGASPSCRLPQPPTLPRTGEGRNSSHRSSSTTSVSPLSLGSCCSFCLPTPPKTPPQAPSSESPHLSQRLGARSPLPSQLVVYCH